MNDQARYEASLGTFLVRFNLLDQVMSWLIEAALRQAGLEALGVKLGAGSFARKLETLELIAKDSSTYRHNLSQRLKALSQARNKLAHADIDLSPMSEDFRIALKLEHPIDPGMLPALTAEADAITNDLVSILTEVTLFEHR